MSRDERAAKRARTTAAALTKAAYDDEEPEIAYDKTHYNGDLNGSFMTDDAVEFFAGGDEGGGGKFESENRAMARPAAIAAVMEIAKTKAGLESGNTVIDVGAGTGLMVSTLTDEVGKDGKMFAVDLSERFVSFLKKRFAALCKTSRLKCSLSTAKTLPAVPTESCDVAFIIDVYHHFTHPRSFMRSLALCVNEIRTRASLSLPLFPRPCLMMLTAGACSNLI